MCFAFFFLNASPPNCVSFRPYPSWIHLWEGLRARGQLLQNCHCPAVWPRNRRPTTSLPLNRWAHRQPTTRGPCTRSHSSLSNRVEFHPRASRGLFPASTTLPTCHRQVPEDTEAFLQRAHIFRKSGTPGNLSYFTGHVHDYSTRMAKAEWASGLDPISRKPHLLSQLYPFETPMILREGFILAKKEKKILPKRKKTMWL